MRHISTVRLLFLGIALVASGPASAFENLDCKGLAERMRKKDVQILDVRTEDEFSTGHISGAILISVSDPEFARKAGERLDPKREVAVYCRSGRRSAVAAARLEEMGYRVSNLMSGILGWNADGRPTER